MARKKQKIMRAVCRHPDCGARFSYRPSYAGMTRTLCPEHQPTFSAGGGPVTRIG